MTVTKVEPLTKMKFKVYLDGQFAFVLYKGELSRFGIKEGVNLSEEMEEKIRMEVILKRAKLRALHLLEDMDRTEAALREKLRQGMYSADAVDKAVEYVKSFGYLNDARYAVKAAKRSALCLWVRGWRQNWRTLLLRYVMTGVRMTGKKRRSARF